MAKKAAALSQKTLTLLKDAGFPRAKVERWNSFVGIRQDLFGFIDIVALGRSIVGIQVCAASGRAAHRDKITASPMAAEWLLSQGAIWLLSWDRCPAQRGSKAVRWVPTLETFSTVVLPSEPFPELCQTVHTDPQAPIPFVVQVQSVHRLHLKDREGTYRLLADLSSPLPSIVPVEVPKGESMN